MTFAVPAEFESGVVAYMVPKADPKVARLATWLN